MCPQSKATTCIRLQSVLRVQGQPRHPWRGGGETRSLNLSSSVVACSFSTQKERQRKKISATFEPAVPLTSPYKLHPSNHFDDQAAKHEAYWLLGQGADTLRLTSEQPVQRTLQLLPSPMTARSIMWLHVRQSRYPVDPPSPDKGWQ